MKARHSDYIFFCHIKFLQTSTYENQVTQLEANNMLTINLSFFLDIIYFYFIYFITFQTDQQVSLWAQNSKYTVLNFGNQKHPFEGVNTTSIPD